MKKNPVDKVKDDLEKLAQKTYRRATPWVYGQKYFYVLGWTEADKVAALGPFMSEREADSALTEFIDGEIFEYNTRDLHRATRQMKAELLSRGEDPDTVLRRMLHVKGLEREGKHGR